MSLYRCVSAGLLVLACASTARAEDPGRLPGVDLSFEVQPESGAWALGQDLPPAFVEAGVEPGWTLTAVDGIAVRQMPRIQRTIAEGPARTVQLEFDTPDGETVLVVERAAMVRLSNLGVVPWPAEFAPGDGVFRRAEDGHGRIADQGGVWWDFDPSTGALVVSEVQNDRTLGPGVSPVWWHLSDSHWALIGEGTVRTGDQKWAMESAGGCW